jgi:hypothetical protein
VRDPHWPLLSNSENSRHRYSGREKTHRDPMGIHFGSTIHPKFKCNGTCQFSQPL